MRIPSGNTNKYVYFVAVDDTDFTTREQGITNWSVVQSRNGGSSTSMTGTITEITGMTGVYSLLINQDTTIASGNDSEELCLTISAPGVYPITRVIELYRPKATEGRTISVDSTGAIETINHISDGAIGVDTFESGILATDEDIAVQVLKAFGPVMTITGSPSTSQFSVMDAASGLTTTVLDNALMIHISSKVNTRITSVSGTAPNLTFTISPSLPSSPSVSDQIVIFGQYLNSLS